MEDRDESIKKARKFADTALAAAREEIALDFRKEQATIREHYALRGLLHSSNIAVAMAEAYAKHIDRMVQAQLDGLLEGYELHEVPLDDAIADEIMEDVMRLQAGLVTDAQRSLAHGIHGDVVRSGCKFGRAAVKLRVDRRRMSPKKEQA
jgi:hypothetical protein